MTKDGHSQLDAWLTQTQCSRWRLLLVVHRTSDRRDSTKLPENWHGCTSINLSLALSQRLLDLPTHQRAAQAPIILADLLAGQEPTLLHDIELLFEPTLQLEPLRALKAASRSRSLAVLWPGIYEDGRLTYAEPGHPEYRQYSQGDLAEILVVPALELSPEA